MSNTVITFFLNIVHAQIYAHDAITHGQIDAHDVITHGQIDAHDAITHDQIDVHNTITEIMCFDLVDLNIRFTRLVAL